MPRANEYLTVAEKMDARSALVILRESGLSLTDAAKLAVAGVRPAVACSVADGVDRFLREKLRSNKRGKTMDWYFERLGKLQEAFGAREIGSIDAAEVHAWIDGLDTGETARAATARASRTFWRWAMRKQPALAVVDATVGLKARVSPRGGKQVVILPVETVAAILAGAGVYQSAVALQLFAGVRPEELGGRRKPRLRWGSVNVEERFIRIPGEVSKVDGRPRVLEDLPDALWAWLVPGLPAKEVAPHGALSMTRRVQRAGGFRVAGDVVDGDKPNWPQDAMRHTFASYALALTSDPGLVSTWLGHEGRPTLLHSTYKGSSTIDGQMVTRAMAERFFSLRPKSSNPANLGGK